MADPQLAPLVGHMMSAQFPPLPPLDPLEVSEEGLPSIPHGDDLEAAASHAAKEEEESAEVGEEEERVRAELRGVVGILDGVIAADTAGPSSPALSQEHEALQAELDKQEMAASVRGQDDKYATWHVDEVVGKQEQGSGGGGIDVPWLRVAEAASKTIWGVSTQPSTQRTAPKAPTAV